MTDSRSPGHLATAAAALVLALTGCGGDDSSDAHRADAPVLSEEDEALLEARLTELSTRQVREQRSVSGGGYSYSPADRFVTAYPSDWQTPVERCQAIADHLAELEGPPGTVPIQVVEERDDGTGILDRLVRGEGGGTCSEE